MRTSSAALAWKAEEEEGYFVMAGRQMDRQKGRHMERQAGI